VRLSDARDSNLRAIKQLGSANDESIDYLIDPSLKTWKALCANSLIRWHKTPTEQTHRCYIEPVLVPGRFAPCRIHVATKHQ
jgi:hypothetical protein